MITFDMYSRYMYLYETVENAVNQSMQSVYLPRQWHMQDILLIRLLFATIFKFDSIL